MRDGMLRPLAGAGQRDAHPAVRLLVESRLVEGDVMVACGHGEDGLELKRHGHRVWDIDPHRMDVLGRTFRTVLDLGWFQRLADRDRGGYVRAVGDAVEPDGLLHVLCHSDRSKARVPGLRCVKQADLLRPFRCGWTLLSVQDSWTSGNAGRPHHAWLASFVRTPVRRRPGRPAVRNFSDLGAFSSLDLGTSTERRPPWGR